MTQKTKSMNFKLHTEYKLIVDTEVIQQIDVYMHKTDEMAIVDDGDCHIVEFDEKFEEVTNEVFWDLQNKQDEIVCSNRNVITGIKTNKVW